MDLFREEIIDRLLQVDRDIVLLDKLIEDVCYGMLNDFDVNTLKSNYESYKERFK